ncbi:MAG: DUF5060 domain-containing protein [Chloroflexi bacterium]|nr:DUF5060 domain-containing protein [Chloroflexota bacterium]
MNVQLILFGFAFILRSEGALVGREDTAVPLRILGRLLRLTAVWFTLVGVGAWAPVWPLLVVAVIGAVWAWRQEDGVMAVVETAVLDVLLVVIAALASLPPLGWGVLIGTAVVVVVAGFVIDAIAIWAQSLVNWQWLAVVGTLPVILLAFVPSTRSMMTRLLSSRFVYLLPDEADDVIVATPVIRETAVSVEATSSPDNTPVPTLPDPTPPVVVQIDEGTSLDAIGTQWSPYIEWSLDNPSYDGNPFDVVAIATFVHEISGETRTTGIFFAGDDEWRFRFTGTQPGVWTFSTASDDPDLNGHEGTVTSESNPGVAGFVTNFGNKWGRTGIEEAFIPQYVMIGGPQTYYNNPAEIEHNIQTFFVDHGFNGVHTPVFCRWFDLEKQQCSRVNVADPNPDLRTFEALESLIRDVHTAGGVVHIWMWGDDSRSENPKRWGLNETADLRLQRYIAARLGPLPGWTMGYGYDLFEWVDGEDLDQWHDFMQQQLGWTHYLGARSNKNQISQLSEVMDYAAYEQHQPRYEQYVRTIDAYSDKPAFSEDRFRIRNEGRSKDYTMELTRRGLWQSAMAGGVANIWGNLMGAPQANDSLTTSAPYPAPEMIQTYARFFEDRFLQDLTRCNELTDGFCLMRPTNAHYIFYVEDAAAVEMDLSDMVGGETAVAIDTKLPYNEIQIGSLESENQTWTAPYVSDWAIAVGSFEKP